MSNVVQNKTLVFVLGMHRSGTSALAGALSMLGVGSDEDLVEAVPGDNPKGYWEPKQVVEINERVLAFFGLHHMDVSPFPEGWLQQPCLAKVKLDIDGWLEKVFTSNDTVIVKDPRLCRILPLWVEMVGRRNITCKVIHIYRRPEEVIASLQVRDSDFSRVDGELAWLTYNGDALSTPVMDRALISFDSLLASPVSSLLSLEKLLGIKWPVAPGHAVSLLTSFVEPTLAHHALKGKQHSCDRSNLSHLIYDLLSEFELKPLSPAFFERTKSINTLLKDAQYFSGYGLSRANAQLKAEKDNSSAQIAYRDDLVRILQSQLEAEKTNARSQINYRDELIRQYQSQLIAEKDNAYSQIIYRESLIADLKLQLDGTFGSRIRKFVRQILPSDRKIK